MVTGGASFWVPKGGTGGAPAVDGAVYTLFSDQDAAEKSVFTPDHRCLVFFDQSVRGLSPGAPVEFRGIPLGRVVEISFEHSPVGDSRVPVLIEIDTETLSSAVEDIKDQGQILSESVRRGLRAKLSTGSLITGALYIDLDFVPTSGLTLVWNGKVQGEPLPGADLYTALLKIFIGDKPTDPELKAGLLGGPVQ